MQNQSPSTQTSPTSSNDQQAPSIGEALLSEATEASLDELMNRSPDISDAEADRIIEYLRAQREKFAQQEAAPKVKKTPRKKGPILSADEILSDILGE